MNLEKENHSNIIMDFLELHPWYKMDIWEGNKMDIAKESIREISPYRQKIDFTISKNSYVKNEIKYYFGKNLNDSLYSVITVFEGKAHHIKRFQNFINKYYANIKSIIEVPKEELMFKYTNYLIECGKQVKRVNKKGNTVVTPAISLMSTFYNYIYNLLDKTPEIEKDIWDVRKLPIEVNYTNTSTKKIKFEKIHIRYRELVKKYLSIRIVKLQNLSFSIGFRYTHELSRFLNFLNENYPELLINKIERAHIISYMEFIKNTNILDLSSKKEVKASQVYINTNLSIVRKFLTDLKIFDWEEAPLDHIESLFFPGDNPHRTKSQSFDRPKYIPDYIWDQVIENIQMMSPKYVPIVLIMEGSGFRISDVLGLKRDCLEKDNKGDYWLKGDQRKVKYKDHKVPISEELANIIMTQQEVCKTHSTLENNPEKYLFVTYRGPRKGKPQTSATITKVLNDFAKKAEVKDVNGNIYKFNNHAFRHRYGVTLINNGMSIIHVQKLMAHASPEMTLAYAKVHDQNLKESYFKAKSGGIRFNMDGALVKTNIDKQAEENNLELEWIRHNYDSIRMDHGMCIKSIKMKCDYAEKVIEPPCIANNCRSFHVDDTFTDYYKSQINLLERDIKVYEKNGHVRSLEFAAKRLTNYKKILSEITDLGKISGMPKERREYVGEEKSINV